ncbi:hypothetical protein SAMN05428988_3216 [Chitinophaga sp. YR573]|uniref:hypothetical protein n=1 Tax=Chitinophaga sp. YR573 TaxID=1881040 RepID=UPI0008D236B5|nr:hypothetical protein [Chitinophaga sp. YR573]SEW21490.1 hypothetical protein SAMN05428988_3216 [Chitinophaga sp. YR573]
MDFSLTTMFVLPPNNTLPVAGSTEDLLPKQFGVFGAAYQPYSSVNEPYLYLAQGRLENVPNTGSKKSGKIAKNKIVSWYKVTAEPNTYDQSTIVSDFQVKCGDQMTITIRAHSNYIDSGFANGYTQSVTVEAPCCGCGADPCTNTDPADVQLMLDDAIAKFMVSGPFMGSVLSNYIDVTREGEGADAKLIINGKPLTPDGRICDVSANPWEYDRLWYAVFVTKGADTTQDPLVYDRCEQIATVTTTPQYGFIRGNSEQIYQMEKYYYSYQSPEFKTLVNNPGWNGAYESYVVDGQYYDTYYLKFLSVDDLGTWDNSLPQDQTVIIAIPITQSAPFETIMTAYLGAAPTNVSPVVRTTTTTSSSTTSTFTSFN